MPDRVITTWRPDTCGCELNYSWERGSSEDTRVHTAESFTSCEAHKHHVDKHQHFATVLEENQRKNKVVGMLVEKYSVKATEFAFKFQADRTLEIFHPTLSMVELQDEVDRAHGKNKVRLN